MSYENGYLNPFPEKSKQNSLGKDGIQQILNQSQSQRNVDYLDPHQRRPSQQIVQTIQQPNNYGLSQTSQPVAQYPQFNYPIMGQKTMIEQDNLELIQKLQKENDTLKQQWRVLNQENEKLKNEISTKNNKERLSTNEIDDLQQQIYLLKNDNKRLTQIIQDDQYQLLEIQKLKKQADQNKNLENQLMETEQQIANLNKQNIELKRQNGMMESDFQIQKEQNEKLKNQIKELTINNDSFQQKQEMLLNDNRRMKQQLDMINKDFIQEQEKTQILNQKLNQLSLQSKDQISNLQQNLTNKTYQNEQQKNQIIQLQQKEKELANQQNINIQLDAKFRQMQQQLTDQQRQIEQYTSTINTGKNEYTKVLSKSQQLEQELWKMKESMNSQNTQKDLLQNKCFQLEKVIEEGLTKSQLQQQELKGQLDQWRNYGLQMEQELKKREMAITQLETEYTRMENQLKSVQENEGQLRQDRQINIQKMKEMHADLLLYEKKCDEFQRNNQILEDQIKAQSLNLDRIQQEKQQLNQETKRLLEENSRSQQRLDLKARDFEAQVMKSTSDNNILDREVVNLRQQNQQLQSKNTQLENELQREKEKLLQMDTRIRSLENEIHNLQFQQTLKQQYTWNQDFTTTNQNYNLFGQQADSVKPFQSYESQPPKPTDISQALSQNPQYGNTSQQASPNQLQNSTSNIIKSKNYDLRFQQ